MFSQTLHISLAPSWAVGDLPLDSFPALQSLRLDRRIPKQAGLIPKLSDEAMYGAMDK